MALRIFAAMGFFAITACATGVGFDEADEFRTALDAGSRDAGPQDNGGSPDGGAAISDPIDGGSARADGGSRPVDAGAPAVDGGWSARDAGVPVADGGASPPDAGARDAGAPVDAGTPCTPTRTQCNVALECGHIPNGCPGGVYECATLCGGGESWCATLPENRFGNRVYNCVQAARAAHPDWFDGELVVAARAEEYVREVAGCADAAAGAYCIVDSNAPGNEIRCRADDGDVADNLVVRTYGGGGRSSARYTSSCTPAFY